jgi:hypothetical protein
MQLPRGVPSMDHRITETCTIRVTLCRLYTLTLWPTAAGHKFRFSSDDLRHFYTHVHAKGCCCYEHTRWWEARNKRRETIETNQRCWNLGVSSKIMYFKYVWTQCETHERRKHGKKERKKELTKIRDRNGKREQNEINNYVIKEISMQKKEKIQYK